MKTIIIIFSIIFFSNCAFAKAQPDTSLLNVDFRDFFSNDTVSLSINGIVILKSEIITSYSTGLALPIEIFKKGRKTLSVKFLNDIKNIKAEKLVTLVVTLNGRISRYQVDCKKGKYVGFDKVDNKITFVQQQKWIYE